jgi:hypothetical protein
MRELAISQDHLEIQNLLAQVNIQLSDKLAALHLAEIEDEARRLVDLLIEFRAWARQGEVELAEERLVEAHISLLHLTDHAQAVAPMLQEWIESDDTQETDIPLAG